MNPRGPPTKSAGDALALVSPVMQEGSLKLVSKSTLDAGHTTDDQLPCSDQVRANLEAKSNEIREALVADGQLDIETNWPQGAQTKVLFASAPILSDPKFKIKDQHVSGRSGLPLDSDGRTAKDKDWTNETNSMVKWITNGIAYASGPTRWAWSSCATSTSRATRSARLRTLRATRTRRCASRARCARASRSATCMLSLAAS